MLRRVYVENFLLIRGVEIEFEKGLNVITGETGTGKSMTISAVEFVMGKQGNFPEGTAVEIELEKEGRPFILRREIRGGRSRYLLEGRGASLKTIREIVGDSLTIQGQNEFLNILKEEFQREVLDRFGKHYNQLRKVHKLFGEYMDLKRELERLKTQKEELSQQKEFWAFKVEEIESLGIDEKELERLKERAAVLSSAEKIKRLLGDALHTLYDDDNSAYSAVSSVIKLLWKASELGSGLNREIEMLTEIRDRISEITESIRTKDVEFSQQEIEQVNELLFRVQRVESKYGKPYGELLKEVRELKARITRTENLEEEIRELEASLGRKEESLQRMCEELTTSRKKTALSLERKLKEILTDLNMERAILKVNLKKGNLSEHGWDRVEFLFSSYGKDPKPLNEVASGGELTRLFLALALLNPPTDTYIFDEIDAGISGETSLRVARLLRSVSKRMQVIVITHSAPLCAAGDVNFLTEKEFLGDIPLVRIRRLSEEEKVKEVARLMGATTDNTLRGAKDLIEAVLG